MNNELKQHFDQRIDIARTISDCPIGSNDLMNVLLEHFSEAKHPDPENAVVSTLLALADCIIKGGHVPKVVRLDVSKGDTIDEPFVDYYALQKRIDNSSYVKDYTVAHIDRYSGYVLNETVNISGTHYSIVAFAYKANKPDIIFGIVRPSLESTELYADLPTNSSWSKV